MDIEYMTLNIRNDLDYFSFSEIMKKALSFIIKAIDSNGKVLVQWYFLHI